VYFPQQPSTPKQHKSLFNRIVLKYYHKNIYQRPVLTPIFVSECITMRQLKNGHLLHAYFHKQRTNLRLWSFQPELLVLNDNQSCMTNPVRRKADE
jgi:hypothetical protein